MKNDTLSYIVDYGHQFEMTKSELRFKYEQLKCVKELQNFTTNTWTLGIL